jgi:hypothetical protein
MFGGRLSNRLLFDPSPGLCFFKSWATMSCNLDSFSFDARRALLEEIRALFEEYAFSRRNLIFSESESSVSLGCGGDNEGFVGVVVSGGRTVWVLFVSVWNVVDVKFSTTSVGKSVTIGSVGIIVLL